MRSGEMSSSVVSPAKVHLGPSPFTGRQAQASKDCVGADWRCLYTRTVVLLSPEASVRVSVECCIVCLRTLLPLSATCVPACSASSLRARQTSVKMAAITARTLASRGTLTACSPSPRPPSKGMNRSLLCHAHRIFLLYFIVTGT